MIEIETVFSTPAQFAGVCLVLVIAESIYVLLGVGLLAGG